MASLMVAHKETYHIRITVRPDIHSNMRKLPLIEPEMCSYVFVIFDRVHNRIQHILPNL
jgi:hypothetical protein